MNATNLESTRPAYIVGVVGDYEIREEQLGTLKDNTILLFDFLCGPNQSSAMEWRAVKEKIIDRLPITTGKAADREAYFETLGEWHELKNTPVVLLSSLAPGAPLEIAEIAHEYGIKVCPVLPVGYEQFRQMSIFEHGPGKRFDELVEKLKENILVVELESDMVRCKDQLIEKETGRKAIAVEPSRNDEFKLRMKAIGDYIASYSHLMLAVWDDLHENEDADSTKNLIRARRVGPQQGLLPTTDALAMSHGGPTLHLRVQHPNNNRFPSGLPVMQFLQSWLICDNPDARDEDANWQRQGLFMMAQIAKNLERFNSEAAVSGEKTRQEMCDRLGCQNANKAEHNPCLTGEMQEKLPEFARRLGRIASLRQSASAASIALAQAADRTVIGLFVITLVAAFSFDAFAHWHPQSESSESAHGPNSTEDQTPNATDPHPSSENAESEELDQWPVFVWLGKNVVTKRTIGAVLFSTSAFALSLFWWQRSKHRLERMHDYRAVAEGARVQFYWHLTGVSHSVSANYVDRQRNELDWIRGAIRSAAMPYEDARLRFALLPRARQIEFFRSAKKRWVTNQKEYFQVKSLFYETQLHLWHKLGNVFALSGLAIVAFVLYDSWRLGGDLNLLKGHGGICFIIATVVVVSWYWVAKLIRRLMKFHDHDLTILEKKDHLLLVKTSRWLEVLVPKDERKFPHRRTRALFQYFLNFVWYLPVAIALATLLLSGCALLADHADSFPDHHNLALIVAGWALIAGALSVAWTEKNLHSELSYQYNNMFSLFDYAERQLTTRIDELESTKGDASYEKQLIQIQDAIHELGREALGENAEWLILHRARPLEPVMAG